MYLFHFYSLNATAPSGKNAFHIENDRFFMSEGTYAGLAKGDKLTVAKSKDAESA
jgi:hypothetical protein